MTPNQQSDPTDQILNALAHAAPPKGMEQRILQSLEAAQPAPAPTRPFLLRWPPILAFSVATAAILIMLTTVHYPNSPRPTPHSVTYPPVPHLRDSLIVAKVGIGEAGPSTDHHTRQRASIGHVKSGTTEGAHSASTTQPTLVSYPAPPMPLTPQEKLLLRIAHHDDPQSLAPLTPAARAAEQARDNAAFQNFFPPPVPVEYLTLISQSNPPAHGASR